MQTHKGHIATDLILMTGKIQANRMLTALLLLALLLLGEALLIALLLACKYMEKVYIVRILG